MKTIKIHYSSYSRKHKLFKQRHIKLGFCMTNIKKLQPKLPNIDKYSSGVHRLYALTVPYNTWDKQSKIPKML
jgi:hypothetical protein